MRTSHRNRPAILYTATNKVNGKRYVGITCRSLAERRSKHFWSALKDNSQTCFHRAIRKHGRECFEFTVLRLFDSYDDAVKGEIAVIAGTSPEYNQSKGGDGYLGWSPSAEQRSRASEQRRGRPGPWRGKLLCASFYAGRRAWNTSDEGKRSWASYSKLGPQAMQRSVICLDDGLSYPSVRSAAKVYGIAASTISSVCLGHKYRLTAGGRRFRFAEQVAA